MINYLIILTLEQISQYTWPSYVAHLAFYFSKSNHIILSFVWRLLISIIIYNGREKHKLQLLYSFHSISIYRIPSEIQNSE